MYKDDLPIEGEKSLEEVVTAYQDSVRRMETTKYAGTGIVRRAIRQFAYFEHQINVYGEKADKRGRSRLEDQETGA